MIEYFDERPDMHHEIGALDYMRFTGAPYLASIHSKLKSHKDDDRCHITDEERDKWNRKVDKSTFYELENKVLTKADKKEIPVRLSQLQNDTAFITAADINSRLIGEGYVTEDDLSDYVKKNELTGYISTWVNGQSYVTRTELNGTLGGYVTQRQLTEAIRGNMTPSGGGDIDIDLSEYAKKSELPGMAAATVLGTVKAARTNNNMSSGYWPVKLTADGVAYVSPNLPEGDDSSISEEIVHSWVNAAFDDAADDILNEVIRSAENGTLKDKITTVAGTVADGRINASGLQLAADRAALLVDSGIIEENGNTRVLKSAGFIAAINGNTSAAKIQADKIFLDGETIADKISATDMNLSGHIVATDLEIVKPDGDVNGGNGQFAGYVDASSYRTTNNSLQYDGATQDVTINGVTLMFVNGLFVGSSNSGGSSADVAVGGYQVLPTNLVSSVTVTRAYRYLGESETTELENHTKDLQYIRIAIDNDTQYEIYTDVYLNGRLVKGRVVIPANGTNTVFVGFERLEDQAYWKANTTNGPILAVGNDTTHSFYYSTRHGAPQQGSVFNP